MYAAVFNSVFGKKLSVAAFNNIFKTSDANAIDLSPFYWVDGSDLVVRGSRLEITKRSLDGFAFRTYGLCMWRKQRRNA